jgi:hypothetical protein
MSAVNRIQDDGGNLAVQPVFISKVHESYAKDGQGPLMTLMIFIHCLKEAKIRGTKIGP